MFSGSITENKYHPISIWLNDSENPSSFFRVSYKKTIKGKIPNYTIVKFNEDWRDFFNYGRSKYYFDD